MRSYRSEFDCDGSGGGRASILEHHQHPQRINRHSQTVSQNLLPRYPNFDIPPLFRHLSSLSLHSPYSLAASVRPLRRLLRLVEAPDFPVLVPHLPLRLLSPLHRRRGLHCRLSLHLQARLLLLHHLCHSQRFQAPIRHFPMGFSHYGSV